MIHTIDQTQPAAGSKWAFDSDVTRVFDNMLARSIPDYDTMRKLVYDLGSRFIRQEHDVLDVGCSRGAGLKPFIDWHGPYCRFIGLDESLPMIEAAREEFRNSTDIGMQIEFRDHDLREGLPEDVKPTLTLCILTAMFVPPECRQRLIADIFNATLPGGALILVEKTIGNDAESDRLLVDTFYDMKRAHGYTAEQIESKRKSLQGVLMPLTTEANVAMLKAEGFKVQEFWRALNFAGWIAIKPKAGV